jgi:hypothetical protein
MELFRVRGSLLVGAGHWKKSGGISAYLFLEFSGIFFDIFAGFFLFRKISEKLFQKFLRNFVQCFSGKNFLEFSVRFFETI